MDRAEYQKRYREEHREELREYFRQYHRANRERISARQRKHRADNPELYAERARAPKRMEQQAAYQRRWRLRYPEKSSARSSARRAVIAKAPTVEKIDRLYIYERDGGRCHLCLKKVSPSNFHLDHLVPLSRGGDHVAANVRVAHPACNNRRYNGLLPAQLLLIG